MLIAIDSASDIYMRVLQLEVERLKYLIKLLEGRY